MKDIILTFRGTKYLFKSETNTSFVMGVVICQTVLVLLSGSCSDGWVGGASLRDEGSYDVWSTSC